VGTAQYTLSISQAAEELGVSVSYLRLAERLGVVPEARRSVGGHRRYTVADIEHLRRVGVGARKRGLQEVAS
jgi:DNA-binding transcriptional MerR regulator